MMLRTGQAQIGTGEQATAETEKTEEKKS